MRQYGMQVIDIFSGQKTPFMSRKYSVASLSFIQKVDISTPGVYKLIENDIIYDLNYLQFTNLKISGRQTVAEWYSLLNKFMQGEVKKTVQVPGMDKRKTLLVAKEFSAVV